MVVKNNKKEFARDFLALGSWVFFVLVIARAAIEPYRPFIDQVILAGVLLVVIGLIFKGKKFYDPYVARGLVLVIFTTIESPIPFNNTVPDQLSLLTVIA